RPCRRLCLTVHCFTAVLPAMCYGCLFHQLCQSASNVHDLLSLRNCSGPRGEEGRRRPSPLPPSPALECARPTDLGLARICTACAEGDRTRRPPLTQNRGSAVLPRSPEGISVPRRRRRKHSKFGPSTSAIKLALPPSDNYQGAAALAMCILSSMRQEGLSARKMLNYVCCCTQLRRISLQTSEAQGASAFKCEPPHIEIPLSLQVQLMDSPKEHA
ncbi:unnamed protein product, partial [Prorocentrum cordatum]